MDGSAPGAGNSHSNCDTVRQGSTVEEVVMVPVAV
jgi:hypothetical protein